MQTNQTTLCNCTCGDDCPLGKTGIEPRCSVADLAAEIERLKAEVCEKDKEIAYLSDQGAAMSVEIGKLKAVLSSGICSAHMEPDPLNCDTCNKVVGMRDVIEHRDKRIAELEAQIQQLKNGWDESNKQDAELIETLKRRIVELEAQTRKDTAEIEAQDKKIAAMAEILERVPHKPKEFPFYALMQTPQLGPCADDCPRCAYEKLKGGQS